MIKFLISELRIKSVCESSATVTQK